MLSLGGLHLVYDQEGQQAHARELSQLVHEDAALVQLLRGHV